MNSHHQHAKCDLHYFRVVLFNGFQSLGANTRIYYNGT